LKRETADNMTSNAEMMENWARIPLR